MSYRDLLPVSWADIDRDAASLSAQALLQRPWAGLIAIARGGLIPATLVAHHLDVRRIEVVSIVTYDHRARGAPDVLQAPQIAAGGADWLVVDDLVDTGTTMRVIRGMFPRAAVAVLYTKPQGHALADAFVRSVPQETWIHFPWDQAPAHL